MNPLTFGIGAAAIVYGLFTLVARAKWPQMFKQLQPMKDRWGPRAGLAVHFVGYTVLPIAFGIYAVRAGLAGASLF